MSEHDDLKADIERRQTEQAQADAVAAAVVDYINSLMGAALINEFGVGVVKKLILRYSVQGVLDAADESAARHLVAHGGIGGDNQAFFNDISSFAAYARIPAVERQMFYIRGILRNRLNYLNEDRALEYIKLAYSMGYGLEELTNLAKTVKTWRHFCDVVEGWLYGSR
mgnify:CR=1 FL=1